MRSGILQLLLAALVLFQVVLSEKDDKKTSEIDNEKDIAKEETGHVSFHMRPLSGPGFGSRSVSRSKSSSKSSGNGSGKGYGYGSNGPDDKGPQAQGGSYSSAGYRGPGGSSYSPSYEDDSKGSSAEAYKSSKEETGYRGVHSHRDSSPEYSTSYEEQYDNRGRYGPHYQGDKTNIKSYSGGQSQNRGYSSSAGRYGKDDDLPSVSPDGYIESHSNQQTSAEKYDAPQGYAGPKEAYGGQSYQGYQGGPHLTSSQGYGEYSERDVSAGYGGPTAYGGFTPMTNTGSPKHEPYSNAISGKEIDGDKVSLFIKQLGGVPLSEIQGKSIYESGQGKFGVEKGQQQGFLLFPVVPKGLDGVNTQGIAGYSGLGEGKATPGILKDAGYNPPSYPSHAESYRPQHQGRDYVGASGGYDMGGHQVENAAYHQDKGGYGQTHNGAGVYGKSGSSAGAGHSGKATYGLSGGESYGIAAGHGAYDNSAKYGSPDGKASGHGSQYPVKSGPVNDGYGYNIASGGTGSYKNTADGSSAGTGRDYRGVVSFAGGQSSGYAGGNPHAVQIESHGKTGATYDAPGSSGGSVSYGHIPEHGGHSLVGYGGDGSRSPATGYADVSSKGQSIPRHADSQPVAPKGKKSKSVAIILQKQPLNVPSVDTVAGFGPELDTQFKAPFKDYLGGSGFDFNLGSYGAGISDFGTGLKGRVASSDFLHGLDGYGAGLTPVIYGNNNAKFY